MSHTRDETRNLKDETRLHADETQLYSTRGETRNHKLLSYIRNAGS